MSVSTTAQALIEDSMKRIGALASGEALPAAEAADAFRRLNELVDNWSTQRLTQRVIAREVFDLVGNQASYTIGTGGNFNTARPEFVDDVRLILTTPTPDNEIPLSPLTSQAYTDLVVKALTSTQPSHWYYDPTMPTGTLYLWPIPDNSTNDVALYLPRALEQFAALSTVYVMAPGYYRALRLNLALELAPEFGREVDGQLAVTAAQALSDIKHLNVEMADLELDPAYTTGSLDAWYNIYTDA